MESCLTHSRVKRNVKSHRFWTAAESMAAFLSLTAWMLGSSLLCLRCAELTQRGKMNTPNTVSLYMRHKTICLMCSDRNRRNQTAIDKLSNVNLHIKSRLNLHILQRQGRYALCCQSTPLAPSLPVTGFIYSTAVIATLTNRRALRTHTHTLTQGWQGAATRLMHENCSYSIQHLENEVWLMALAWWIFLRERRERTSARPRRLETHF